jgi:hypothetical protein
MRRIAGYLRQFLKEDFHGITYGATFLFLAIFIYINYAHDFADAFIYKQKDGLGKLLRWIAFMAFPYLIVLGFQRMFQRPAHTIDRPVQQTSFHSLKSPAFWLTLTLAFLMVSVTAWFPWHKTLARELFPGPLQRWALLVLWNLKRFAFMLLPMLIYWWAVDRRRNRFYGLFARPKGLGVYFAILLLLAPLIVIASFQPDFLKAYPQYHAGKAEAAAGVSPWLTGAIFEFVYGADFALVELLFRGFLVIGLLRWLGPRTVLPMAAMYCFLHFGKPAGETVASFFGGYALGVIAYYSRSIWGGIVVHMGIAWMMEAAAYIQKDLLAIP